MKDFLLRFEHKVYDDYWHSISHLETDMRLVRAPNFVGAKLLLKSRMMDTDLYNIENLTVDIEDDE